MSWWPLIKLLPQKTNFRFVRWAPLLGVISTLACIASLFFTLYPLTPPCGGLNCGVDFRGGSVMEFTAPRPVDLGVVRDALEGSGLADVSVQNFSGPGDASGTRSVSVRFRTPEDANPAQTVGRVQQTIAGAIGPVTYSRTDVVGPKVSGELLVSGISALGVAVLLMLAYIWFRFGLTFGIGAVAGLAHDVLLTFGLFALFDLEFTLTSVAAILTIIGYGINDTVVVLDRVRENLRKYKRLPMRDVIDLSINETLSRTIMTGATGLMALTVLAVFGGGGELFVFSIAMIFGIIIGTYSSLYVAAPVMMLLNVRRGGVRTDAEDDAEPIGPQPATPGAGRPVPRP